MRRTGTKQANQRPLVKRARLMHRVILTPLPQIGVLGRTKRGCAPFPTVAHIFKELQCRTVSPPNRV